MLFVAPECHGRGIGKSLLLFAIEHLNVNRVNVNEQNTKAMEFYSHMGFKLEGRSPLDSEGRTYPILHLVKV
ncbi:MAG: GNAT family N-acetyltransferase [Clostridium sp.]|nr:GNAT family N-acetyltransferase [Bacteroides sp.]MCM1199110.1 GNAT family N-acetyltransferase [Clostridium sp.]